MAEVDIGGVFQLLGSMAGDLRQIKEQHGAKLETLSNAVSELKQDMVVVKHDIGDLKHGLASLNQTVTEYHAAVLGHGVSITDLDERLRRVEQHLGLPPVAAE